MDRRAAGAVADWDDDHALLTRLLALRKAGRIGVILADCGVYYLCADECDPWGSRERRSKEELWELVRSLEAQTARGTQSERRGLGLRSKSA